jgi:hypothetical protein
VKKTSILQNHSGLKKAVFRPRVEKYILEERVNSADLLLLLLLGDEKGEEEGELKEAALLLLLLLLLPPRSGSIQVTEVGACVCDGEVDSGRGDNLSKAEDGE